MFDCNKFLASTLSCVTPAGDGKLNASTAVAPGIAFPNGAFSIISTTSSYAVLILVEALLEPDALEPSVVTDVFSKSLACLIEPTVCVLCTLLLY